MNDTSVRMPVHQRVVDVAAVVHARLVAREHHRRERLRPHRQREHLVAEDALRDELAHGLEPAIGRGLAIVLDQPRREARGLAPVDERSRARAPSRTVATSSAESTLPIDDLHAMLAEQVVALA